MKVFKEKLWFDFKPITLLTGTNNSGKSSVINAMQMLQQNLPNHFGNTIDNLVQTKFRLTSNQNKYGSLKNFVNRDTPEQLNNFLFARRSNNVQYNILVEINDGIDIHGQVKHVHAIDPKTEETIFLLEVIERNPKLICKYKINYKYFKDEFEKKCQNTIQLHDEQNKLKKLTDLVNEKIEPVSKLTKLANEISEKYQVYVSVFDTVGIDDLSRTECMISNEPFLSDYEIPEIEEIGAFFEKDNSTLGHVVKGLRSKNEILEIYKKGLFDFDKLFKNIDPEVKFEFDNIVLDYYNLDKNQAYLKLNEDLIEYLSSIYWEIEEIYSEEDPQLVPNDLIKTYLNCHPDFGLIASCIGVKREKDKYGRKDYIGSKTSNNFLIAKPSRQIIKDELKGSKIEKFETIIFEKLKNIIFNNEDIDSKNREVYIFKEIADEMFKEIEKKIFKINIGFNNTFVSSARFQEKRTYNLNDNSDFSSLIKKIESSESKIKENCFSFINKWLNEFEIAEEIIFKSDPETGNFKAYLNINGKSQLLADFGLGTNQLLPVIFSLALQVFETEKYFPYEIVMANRTVVIEEPEANLHPAMQSKLADLFVDAYKTFKVQIIAETHSEYLIRKLQFLVGSTKGNLKSEDVAIYYFYKPNHPAVLIKEVNQVEKIEIDEFGRLTKEFGSGFFDEADKISMDVFMLKFSQNN